jgi:mRNA interferase MazF
MMRIGDVVWVELPSRADRATSEQSGLRPAIFVQDDVKHAALPTAVVVPLTSRLAALRFTGTLLVRRSPLNNLTSDSVALVFQVQVVDRRRLRNTIGSLDSADLGSLHAELASLFALGKEGKGESEIAPGAHR